MEEKFDHIKWTPEKVAKLVKAVRSCRNLAYSKCECSSHDSAYGYECGYCKIYSELNSILKEK